MQSLKEVLHHFRLIDFSKEGESLSGGARGDKKPQTGEFEEAFRNIFPEGWLKSEYHLVKSKK